MSADDLRVDDRDIEAVISKYLVTEMPVTDPRWPTLRDKSIFRDRSTLAQKLRKLLRSRLPRARKPETVSALYKEHWTKLEAVNIYVGRLNDGKFTMQWRDRGLELKKQALRNLHLLAIGKVIAATKPTTVLDVGSGNGNIVLALAGMFPEVRFTAVELTEAGVEAARSLMAFDRVPDDWVAAAPLPILDRSAHKRVTLMQGSAAALPFTDRQFDMAYTSLALEQMESIREAALREITRVASRTLALYEPWRDFNETGPGRDYVKRQGYFAANSDDLVRYGFKPVLVSADLPQKVQFSTGPVVAFRA